MHNNQLPSELTFTNLFVWKNIYNYRYFIFENFIWIVSLKDNKINYFLSPIGDYSRFSKTTIQNLSQLTKHETINDGICFKRIGKEQVRYFTELQHSINHVIDNDDYLYLSKDMASLSKNIFRKKRQHITKIKANHIVTQSVISPDNIDFCKRCLLKVNSRINTDGVTDETKAMMSLLDNYFDLGCNGILLLINNDIAAFTIGEKLDDQTYVIHLEKGMRQYTGVYQLVFQEFSKSIQKDYLFINREQDMGLPGLRQAKQSYFPIKKLEKFDIQIIFDKMANF